MHYQIKGKVEKPGGGWFTRGVVVAADDLGGKKAAEALLKERAIAEFTITDEAPGSQPFAFTAQVKIQSLEAKLAESEGNVQKLETELAESAVKIQSLEAKLAEKPDKETKEATK